MRYQYLLSKSVIAFFVFWRLMSNFRRYFYFQRCVWYCKLGLETFGCIRLGDDKLAFNNESRYCTQTFSRCYVDVLLSDFRWVYAKKERKKGKNSSETDHELSKKKVERIDQDLRAHIYRTFIIAEKTVFFLHYRIPSLKFIYILLLIKRFVNNIIHVLITFHCWS